MKNRFKTTVVFVFLVTVLSACQSENPTAESSSVKANDGIHESVITVYKSPSCSCCQGWVTYLEEEGFNVNAIDHDDVDAIKAKHGLSDPTLKSCHTAIVDGYVVEGHVPANDIERLLREKPTDIIGISAPGMPMMSPGMASRTPKDYNVLSFTKAGDTAIFSQY